MQLPPSPPKGVVQVDKQKADIATWELNTLANMINPVDDDEGMINIDLFADGPAAVST
jgi:hypothetical protein